MMNILGESYILATRLENRDGRPPVASATKKYSAQPIPSHKASRGDGRRYLGHVGFGLLSKVLGA